MISGNASQCVVMLASEATADKAAATSNNLTYHIITYHIIFYSILFYYSVLYYTSNTGVCEKTLLSPKPLPCNTAAETAIQPLIWCFRS